MSSKPLSLTDPLSLSEYPYFLLAYLGTNLIKSQKIKNSLLNKFPLPTWKPERNIHDGFELNLPYYNLLSAKDGKINFKQANRVKKTYANILSTHGCFENHSKPFEKLDLNLSLKLTNTKKELLKNNIELADYLIDKDKSFRPLVLHTGFDPTGDRSRGLGNAIENLYTAIEYAKKKNVNIIIENLPPNRIGYTATTPQDITFLLNSLGNPENLGVCFDLSHATLSSIRDNGTVNYDTHKEFVDELGENIKILHANSNNCIKLIGSYADNDEHAPFKESDIYHKDVEKLITYIADSADIQYITHEIFPNKLFGGLVPFFPKGYKDTRELINSLNFVENCFNKSYKFT